MPYTFFIGDSFAVTLEWQHLFSLLIIILLVIFLSSLSLRRADARRVASSVLPAAAAPSIDAEKEPKALRYGAGKAEGGAWDATGPGYLPDPDPLHDFDLSTATLRDYVYVNKVLRYPYFQVRFNVLNSLEYPRLGRKAMCM